MKITPTNQSLILARDPAKPDPRPSSLLRQASQWAAGGAALKRLTFLEARSDATVVVQADYFSDEEAPSVDAQRPAVEQISSNAITVVGKNPTTLSGPAATSPYRNPIQLYTSVQRGLVDTRAALLDVLA